MMTKKIYVERNDTLAAVVDKVLGIEDREVILYVPRSTKFGSSPSNFRLLKRELDSAGKSVEIESVDDKVLEMAKSIGFKSANPFFKKGSKQISDIVHPGRIGQEHRHQPAIEEEPSIVDDPEPIKREPRVRHHSRKVMSNHHKVIAMLVAAGVLTCGYVGAFVLPEAKIHVSMENIPKDFNGSLITGATVKSAEFSNNTIKIRGVFGEEDGNITKTYPATGTQSLKAKATGEITIYNAYSSTAQNLVVGTRFESPDHKIFRLIKSVLVPGAKTSAGKLVPSSIKADVQADVAGAEYNIPPAHFTIPGFKGTPKYAGFYGDSESAMTGGMVGVSAVATESDIAKAKIDIHKILEDSLRVKMISGTPQDIKMIDAATSFIVTKEDINKVADSNDNFKITTYGSIRFVGFKEADIRAVLEPEIIREVESELAASDAKTGVDNSNIGVIVKDSSISYGEPRVDFVKKDMSISLKFHSNLRRNLNIEAFRKFAAGKKSADLAVDKLPFPGVREVKMNLWPFWVRNIPTNLSKITVDVE